jgi:glycosyltransferase involved in cell wall biosynthesis
MKDSKYILWLPSWYPNRLEPYNGDFIQRHAVAVAAFLPVNVIYVIKDPTGSLTKDVLMEEFANNGLVETIVYYYVKPKGITILDKLVSHFKYKKVYKQAIKQLFEKKGLPSLVHVHIALKAGVMARWIKNKFKVPFLITEQWTIYLNEARPNYRSVPIYLRRQWKKIFKEANGISVVSDYLGEQIQHLFKIKDYKVIPNVVDLELFSPITAANKDKKEFIHISTLGYQKNVEDILKAFSIIKKSNAPFTLHLVGPDNKALQQLAHDLKIDNDVLFHSEMPHIELVKLLQSSDALILFSRYETFGCVLIEANACGLPVIVSDIPVFHENVKEGVNGIFARNEDSNDLAAKILSFIKNEITFSTEEIVSETKKSFTFSRVGDLYSNWYRTIVKDI